MERCCLVRRPHSADSYTEFAIHPLMWRLVTPWCAPYLVEEGKQPYDVMDLKLVSCTEASQLKGLLR